MGREGKREGDIIFSSTELYVYFNVFFFSIVYCSNKHEMACRGVSWGNCCLRLPGELW